MNNLLDKNIFWVSLNSAVNFFSNVDDPSNLFSSFPDLSTSSKSFFDILRETNDMIKQLTLMEHLVHEVVSLRSKISSENCISSHLDGRFLIYSPFHATMDALASGETDGFFDEADAPPRTTWIVFKAFIDPIAEIYEGYLATWIPEFLIPSAQAGIDTSLGKSLFWADNLDEACSYGDNAVAFCNSVIMATFR